MKPRTPASAFVLSLAVTAVALLAAPEAALAATPAPPAPIAVAAGPAPKPAPTARHLEKTIVLLELMGAERLMMRGFSETMAMQLKASPQLVPFADVIEAWAKEVMKWENVREPLAQLYAEAFTEEEIDGLVTFYRSPLGQKLKETQPELAARGMAVGRKLADARRDDLMRRLDERRKELEAAARNSTAPKDGAIVAPANPVPQQ